MKTTNGIKHILPLFYVHFQEVEGGEWRTVTLDAQSVDDVPKGFLTAFAGIYRPLSECFDFRIDCAESCGQESVTDTYQLRLKLEERLLHLITNARGDNVRASIRLLNLIEIVENYDKGLLMVTNKPPIPKR